MQTSGNLIGTFIELTASVQHCQNHFQSRTMLFGVHTCGNTTSVIQDTYSVARQDTNINTVAIARHGLVDGVVDHLIYQMMQASEMDIADIHGRTFAHSL